MLRRSLIALATTAVAVHGAVTLDLQRLDIKASDANSFRNDNPRSSALSRRFANQDATTIPAISFYDIRYLVAVDIGSPPTTFMLSVDTASSFLLIGYVSIIAFLN